MPTRLQRLRRLLIFSPLAAALVGGSALSLSTAQAATPKTVCILGICVGSSPTPAPAPAPRPTPAPPPPATAPPAPVPTGSGVPPAPPATGLLGGVTGTTGGTSSGSPASGAPQCSANVAGNCVSLLPGVVGPAQPPVAGEGPGTTVGVPDGQGGIPLLTIGDQGCLAALLSTCAASSTPPAPSGGSGPPACVATLLSLCVPNAPGVGGTTQCVAGSTACATVPSGCVGSTCVPGTNPGQPPGGTGTHNGGSSGGGSQSGQGSTSAGSGSGATAGGGSSASLSGAFGSASAAPGAQQTAAFGSVAAPAIPTSGEFAGLGGLHLGAMILWPIFAVLDVLAIVAIVVLARRSWLAAPGD